VSEEKKFSIGKWVLDYHLLAVIAVIGEEVLNGGGSLMYCRGWGKLRGIR